MNEKINDGGPAFPWHRNRNPQEATNSITSGYGMSLRDYFAAKCMQEVMVKGTQGEEYLKARAKECYAFADAMIKARGKP